MRPRSRRTIARPSTMRSTLPAAKWPTRSCSPCSWADVRRLDLLRESLRVLPLPVRLLPDRTVGEILKQPIIHAGGSLAVEVQRSPLTLAEQAQKRLFDIVLASAALVLLAPLFVVTAIAIRLDSPGR